MPDLSLSDVNIGDVFKDLVWSALVKAALSALFKAVPFLGLWFVSPFVSLLVGWFADQLYAAGKEVIDFSRIAFRNVELRKAFDDASIKLKLIARDKGLDSPEFKEAREKHKKSLSAFVRFGT